MWKDFQQKNSTPQFEIPGLRKPHNILHSDSSSPPHSFNLKTVFHIHLYKYIIFSKIHVIRSKWKIFLVMSLVLFQWEMSFFWKKKKRAHLSRIALDRFHYNDVSDCDYNDNYFEMIYKFKKKKTSVHFNRSLKLV